MRTIGVVGTRQRDTKQDYQHLSNAIIEIYRHGDSFVSGGCPKGADRMAEEIARKLGATITIHHAAWDIYGKGAGFMRNAKIAVDCNVLIAVVAADRKGGTEDTIKRVLKQGKRVYCVMPDGSISEEAIVNQE